MTKWLVCAGLFMAGAVHAQIQRLNLVLPTDNRALLEGSPEDFYQFVDRTWEGEKFYPWEGGQFGFVRDPKRLTSGAVVYTRFHEGLDIKPVHRDSNQEPLDEVRSMADGVVMHTGLTPGQSSYGRYVVVKHDWGYGPFFSLYAHLREIKVSPGDKVAAGGLLGIMGYTGSGIDRRRAHVHLELNLFLSSRFQAWHDANFRTPNHHGQFNGLNLIGLDLAGLYRAQRDNPAVTAAGFVMQTAPYYRVAVPGSAEMEIIKNYPWLCQNPPPGKPAAWEITFSAWGLPVRVDAGQQSVSTPTVTWVKESTIPHYSMTRGLLNGSGSTATLSASGLQFINLVSGNF